MNRIKLVGLETLRIAKRILKRDFSGDAGTAIKNSTYTIFTNVITKLGSLAFTIILARMLMPELFGLYSLALSTIILFSAFSDLGINTAIVKYMSRELGKKKGDPSKHYRTLLKWKLVLVTLVSLALIISAGYISKDYYNKPIFLALIAGSLYVFFSSFVGFFTAVAQAHNNFKQSLVKEIIFQISRLFLVPLAVILFISHGKENLILMIVMALSISNLFSLIYLLIKNKSYKDSRLNPPEKKNVLRFIIPLSATALSGMFLSYVDIIMLGRYVEPAFIGFYQAAIALIGSTGALIGFSGALFPLFSRLRGSRLIILFRKSIKYTIILSFLGAFAAIILAGLGIRIIYGAEYNPSILLLRVLALLILIDPLISVYSSFYISQGRTRTVAILLISSTLFNIIVTYFLIQYGLSYSPYAATFGAAVAIIFAKALYLIALIILKRSKKKTFLNAPASDER